MHVCELYKNVCMHLEARVWAVCGVCACMHAYMHVSVCRCAHAFVRVLNNKVVNRKSSLPSFMYDCWYT